MLGLIFGIVFRDEPFIFGLKNEHLGQLGLLVVKLLRTLASPLIFIAIIHAFINTAISARQGGRLIVICAINVSVAMLIGLSILNIFQPGLHWQGKLEELARAVGSSPSSNLQLHDPEFTGKSLDPISNLSHHIPSSIVRPFLYNNVISIVLLALLFGIGLHQLRANSANTSSQAAVEILVNLVDALYRLMIVVLEWVIQLVPFAVFGVVAQVVGSAGLHVFGFLGDYFLVIVAGFALHALLYYPSMAWLVGGKSPRVYFGGGLDAIVTGFSTNSSLATVPVTLKCLTEKLGISHASSRLSACIGTNLNNDGITLYEAMTALFLAQALGMDLNLNQQLFVVFASIMAGAGIAGVPEAGIIVLPLVLQAAGLPEHIVVAAIPLIIPVDWVLARLRSAVNVMSDLLVAVMLERWHR